MQLRDLLEQYYEFFSIRISGHCCRITTEIDNFLKLLALKEDLNSLGAWFCWHYTAFQFSYYYGLKTKLNGKFPANWIFGPKSLQRWYSKNSDNWLYFVQRFLNEANIHAPVEFCQDNLEKKFEEERRRFFNTDMGLFHCLQFAKYSPSSPTCLICKNKRDCKKLWR